MSEPQYPIDLPTDDQVRTYLLENAEAARTLGIESDFEVRFLARGAVNAAYQLSVPGQVDRVLRIALCAANRSSVKPQVECEAAVLQFLSGQNVTADLAWIDLHSGMGYPLLAIGYLDGDPLDYRSAHLKAAARLYARLHNQTEEPPAIVPRVPDPMTQYLKEAQVWVDRYRHWSDANSVTIAAFDAALDRIRARSIEFDQMRLIHGDGTWSNWRIQAEEARIMDWDWCRVTTPAADLAHFLSPITTGRLRGRLLSREEENGVLVEYCAERRIGLIEFERLFRGMRSIVVFHSITWTAAYLVQLAQAQPVTADDQEPEFLKVLKTSGLAQQLDPEFLDWMKHENIW
ncbi:aminoglycoside phosphotransferase family protein [Microcoleus sp. FACHB-1515]|uniref:aminoglycoside phosphotransferase family protein n=1 Tax=Cyanophyceae TaxID=3028117 RepID=UPI0016870C9B|nr:aminoglycoside phosphotransferase family protein [Microcoleus sp. FACHB-1515]MBD2090607.1 aminoglycoside phosphotransferase family protein [Microcoleus sp. FACHB-1515]